MVNDPRPGKKARWRGFTLQFLFTTILPLTLLLLLVVFGSQLLHHQAMRSLVGERDLNTVRAVSASIDKELLHLESSIQMLSRSLKNDNDFTTLILYPEEISALFDGGVAVYSQDDVFLNSSTALIHWRSLPTQEAEYFSGVRQSSSQPTFSRLITPQGSSSPYIFMGILLKDQRVLVGAFSPDRMIKNAIGSLVNSGQSTVLVVSPVNNGQGVDVLFRGGVAKTDESTPAQPGVSEALLGKNGISYYQSSNGEHLVAFDSIATTGWGLVIEEAWETIASPYLKTTQYAPLVIVPAFLLSLVAIWFGARRIVNPLQKLEGQAAGLACGDFEAIHQPVGGIEEIQNLQSEMVDMADRLKTAQTSLRSYIGSVTAGIENERRSLARELHDETIQSLIALNQRIQWIKMTPVEAQGEGLNELQELVQQAMGNLRRLIRGLRPIYLEDLGLIVSLEMLVRESENNTAMPISFTSKGLEQRLETQSEMAIYRMVQESLHNVTHHSEAAHAWVELEFTQDELLVQVRDDGKGFVVPSNPMEFPGKGHFGLLGLQERAEIIHADLKIISAPGQGTNILIRVRVPKNS